MLNLADFVLEDSSLILIISACRTEFRVGWLTYFSELVQGLTWPKVRVGWFTFDSECRANLA